MTMRYPMKPGKRLSRKPSNDQGRPMPQVLRFADWKTKLSSLNALSKSAEREFARRAVAPRYDDFAAA